MAAFTLRPYRLQNLLIEFASLKHVQLRGIYVSLSGGDPALWTGVLFVRKGPYTPAVLRFQVLFPQNYPFSPPLITFGSDMFHPLLVPLTTSTHNASSESSIGELNEESELLPGGFSLRHGFPDWQKRAMQMSEMTDKAPSADSQDDFPYRYSIVDVLKYIRSCFEDEDMLDSIPFNAVGNTGAWYAWQTHRGRMDKARQDLTHGDTGDSSTGTQAQAGSAREPSVPSGTPVRRPRRPSQWNWEGVWEERVKRAVQSSLSEAILYGGNRDDEIHFLNAEQNELDEMRKDIASHLGGG